jgi:CRISPR/Cas system CSM-associated protein Csm2 small subunit
MAAAGVFIDLDAILFEKIYLILNVKSIKIDLNPILNFVKNDPEGYALSQKNSKSKDYARLVTTLVGNDPELLPGFYFLINEKSDGDSNIIYIGKSNNLQRRLRENLKHDRLAFYKDIYKEIKSEWEEIAKADYPKMHQFYANHWERAKSKSGATTIVWVGDESLQHIRLELIEGWLITHFEPSTNTQNTKLSQEYENLKGRSKKIIDAWSKRILNELFSHRISIKSIAS